MQRTAGARNDAQGDYLLRALVARPEFLKRQNAPDYNR